MAKDVKRALMIARDQRALLRRVANIYPGPGGGMDPGPGGGGYAGPGGGKYIGPSRLAIGGRADENDDQWWHGSGSGDLRGGESGLHLGTRAAAEEALNARIGFPAEGSWDGTREYGKTKLAGKNTILKRNKYGLSGHNMDAPDEDYFPHEHPRGLPDVSRDVAMDPSWKPNIAPYRLKGAMSNSPQKPHDDFRANGYMKAALKKGTAKRGYYYRNEGEDSGSISAVVPSGSHVEPYKRASGGNVPPFKLHSGAAKLIEAKGQKKATPQQYAAIPGIKPDELKHSGFDRLGSKALPREEVIKHLEANAVPLQETVYADDDERSARARWGHGDKITLPGGENYREVLLHTHTPMQAANAFLGQLREKYGQGALSKLPLTQTERDRYDELTDRSEDPSFNKSHWEVPNVLAHIRMSDRKGPNGEKVLHVEEVQSDWGQQGRERGFKTDATQRYEDWREGALKRARQKLAEQQIPEETAENFLTAMGMGNRQVGHDALAKYVGEKEHADKLWEEHLKNQSAIPEGPYVDNTQKWTDLALKRVLHEAAHGGYNKVAVTPGDEQNKRYDLSNQVKNITYFPDIGYLHATTHDGEGIEHNDVKPNELAKHIGKEAAEKIMKYEPQRYEGRGRLGGEFYHELEGDDLKMGGQGMRGYYDNIVPKRLQTLAQQHDPQAKVQLGGYSLRTPQNVEDLPEDEQADYLDRDPSGAQRRVPDARHTLHSLDVTPQMRNSIKANGFSQFKRGGEVDDPIKDWHWRPTEDVRNKLQLDEIPSHVHRFGEFMDETARRAAMHGLSPRDLIKAYAITRSSIGRQALPATTVREAFTELPPDVKERVRPEGAMGHWLHTKMGQRYLDAAEAGRVDEEAVAHAQKSMRRFGKEQTEPSALRWAALNLPGKERRVSELIARAHRGQSSPEEWRGEMRMPGVAESKAGFLASMLGRGDQPTLDARQLILHTGRPTKEAVPYLGRKGAPEAAVNRLAERQTALNFKHDKELSPFYQHLAHHAIWDKAAGEETTHEDLMKALRGAKDGGRQGYARGGKSQSILHPVVQGLLEGLPNEAQLRQALARTVSPFSGDPEHVKEALRIAASFKVPTTKTGPGGYYNIAQDRSPEEVAVKLAGLPGVKPKPVRKMSWEDLHKKGGSFINLGGDRSTFGRLTRINGEPLAWPVDLHAGPNYMRELNPGLVWANAPAHATSLAKIAQRAAEKGPVYGVYAPMGPRAVDSAHHMFDAVMAQVPGRSIKKKDAAEFDAQIKQGLHVPPNKRAGAIKALEKWPGILNAKEASEFARTLPGEQRSGIIQHMDKKTWRDKGFPQIGVTRVAITDPDVFRAPGNMLGHRVVQLDPDKMLEETKFKHGTYTAPTAGEYVGDVPLVQRHYAAPDVIEQRLLQPTKAGDIIHPYSTAPVGRDSARKLFTEQKNIQPLNQRQLDSTMLGLQRQKEYGLKHGGTVGRALDVARKINGR